jgi:uncharacterized membrane protein YcaP (DUF421 family)
MMPILSQIQWERMFVPEISLLETFLRGTIMYLAIYFLLRFVLKRQTGALGIADVLVLVLIADAAQNAMADDYHSLTEGLVLVSTIVFWSFALDWLGYHFPRLERIFHAGPLKIVQDGHLLRKQMKKELISEEELLSQLRQHGISDVKKVKEASIEGDGHVSVVKQDQS